MVAGFPNSHRGSSAGPGGRGGVAQARKPISQRGLSTANVRPEQGHWYIDEPFMYVVGSTKYYVHQNHLFSVSAVTDAAGATRERYSYTGYGDRAVRTAAGSPLAKSQVNNGIGFTGYVINAETNQYHARARQFDATLGRFTARDFLGYIDGQSLYSGYMIPNATDALGLSSKWSYEYYEKLKSLIDGGETDIDRLWQKMAQWYLTIDPEDDCVWDCEDDMEEIIEAFFDIFSGYARYPGRPTYAPNPFTWGPGNVHNPSNGWAGHFFLGAAFEGAYELGDTAQNIYETPRSTDGYQDDAYAYSGSHLSDLLDTSEEDCRRIIKMFANGSVTLSGLLGGSQPGNDRDSSLKFQLDFENKLNDTFHKTE
jgi:RHS repeat-associated protein